MDQPQSDVYRTSETAIAAYLVAKGYDLPDIEIQNGHRAFFVFNNPDAALYELVNIWDMQKAPEYKFYSHYTTLIRKVKER